jgi:hypothetical protein
MEGGVKVKTTFIYLITDGTNAYIGKSKHPKIRFQQHMWHFDNTKKSKWLQECKHHGITPELDILKEVPIDEWGIWEKYFIALFDSYGYEMKNSIDGGSGCDEIPQDVRDKISNALKGKYDGYNDKPVYQYTIDGDFIREYKSAMEAERDGSCRINIKRCSRNPEKFASHGFRWSTRKVDRIEVITHQQKVKVVRLNIDGSNPVVYDSLKIPGFLDSKICQCCKGQRQSHKGFKWMYYSDFKQYESTEVLV